MSAWGLLADVHGNLAALEQALDQLVAAGANQFAFLGDYLGRGQPDACVALIQEVATVAVVGNRDLDWQDRVSPASRAWVRSLPRWVSTDGLLLTHGDARLTPGLSTAEIGRGFPRVWPRLAEERAQIFAFGHSHHARLWRRPLLDHEVERLDMTRVVLDDAAQYALNVGSVGLPFPGKGGPSVALVDFDARVIRRVEVTPTPGADRVRRAQAVPMILNR